MPEQAKPGRLQGKVAVITGAAMGLGEAIARRFAQEGARVAAVDVKREPLDATVFPYGPYS